MKNKTWQKSWKSNNWKSGWHRGTIFTSNFPLGYLQHCIYIQINVQRCHHAFSSFQMASLVPRASCRTKAEWLPLVAVACIAGPRQQCLSRHSAVPTGPVRMNGFMLRGSSSQSEARLDPLWQHLGWLNRAQSNGSLVQADRMSLSLSLSVSTSLSRLLLKRAYHDLGDKINDGAGRLLWVVFCKQVAHIFSTALRFSGDESEDPDKAMKQKKKVNERLLINTQQHLFSTILPLTAH